MVKTKFHLFVSKMFINVGARQVLALWALEWT